MHEDRPDSGTELSESPLIGRDDTVDHVAQLLRRHDVGLVTLTGRSGVGKSTVATAVADLITEEDGIGILRAEVDRHGSVAAEDELAAALTAPTGGPVGPAPSGRRRLVLLDGLEALPGAAPLVGAALAADPDLTVLATSVVALALPEEHTVRLEPLGVPGPDAVDPATLTASPAVQLLSTRIREARRGRPADDSRALAALARLLDGLPLALELAAARCADRAVVDVLDEVQRLGAVDVLTDGSSREAHHRSLRATILWSYDLLDGDQRRALRRLGVFAGSFDRSAVHAVTDGDPDVVQALVAAGLARAARPGADGARYELVPSVAMLARELLAADGDLDTAEERHAAHYRAVAAAAAPVLHSPDTAEVRRRLLEDLDELLGAVRHLERTGRRRDALELVVDLSTFWEESAASGIAEQVLGSLLPRPQGDDGVSPELAAGAWATAAMVTVWGHRPFERRDELVDALSLAASTVAGSADREPLLAVLRAHVAMHLIEGQPDRAISAGDAGLSIARELQDPWWMCQFLGWAAAAHTMGGAPDVALPLAIEGRDLALATGDAAQLLRLSNTLAGTAGVETSAEARPIPEAQLISLARRLDDAHAEGVLRASGAVRAVVAGDVRAAAVHLSAAFELGRRKGLWYLEELAMMATVVVATVAGATHDAARLHGALTDVLPRLGRAIAPESLQLYHFAVDQARAAAGDSEFDRGVALGRLVTWDDATELATGVCDELASATTTTDAGATLDPAHAIGPLSPRQTEVLMHLTQGSTNKEIAAALGMRPKTVMHHTSEIYRRLGVRNRTEAVAEAHRLGLVDPA